ncbi:MAG: type II secretion system protein [Candidatus Pacebacteria bacterium]|nr:type II secretion system protein [Candidatus Paceibacterota bacterium]
MYFKKYDNKDKGFTLMEVIVSVGIVAFAFVGVMAVFASNIRVEIASRDKTTASYLAQEAMEIIKNERDTNWFAGGAANWDNGIGAGSHQVLNVIDPSDLAKGWSLENTGLGEEEYYKQRIFLLDGVYVQTTDLSYNDANRPSSWQDTHFRRLIDIERPDIDKIKVTVAVYYGSNDSKVQIVSYLYNNWYTN